MERRNTPEINAGSMADIAFGTAAAFAKRISALPDHDAGTAAIGKAKTLVVGKEITRRKTERQTQL